MHSTSTDLNMFLRIKLAVSLLDFQIKSLTYKVTKHDVSKSETKGGVQKNENLFIYFFSLQLNPTWFKIDILRRLRPFRNVRLFSPLGEISSLT